MFILTHNRTSKGP